MNKTMEDFSEILKPLKKKVAELSAKYSVDAEIVARLMLHCNNEAELEDLLKDWNEEDNEWSEPEVL